MKKLCTLVLTLAAAATVFYVSPTTSAKSEKFHRSDRPISNRYIVVLDDAVENLIKDNQQRASELTADHSGLIHDVYSTAVSGYSVEMSEKEAIQLSDDPRVKYVEEDSVVELQSTESNATWGISRIDQRTFIAPMDSNYNYNTTGAGVSVYVLDTGVLVSHPDFGGRAVDAFDVYHDGGDMTRCNGHGTHVAGTIASTTYGVAKSARIYSVKVYPCDTSKTGSMSDILSGIDWVTRNAVHPAVANMSISGAVSQTLDDAVKNSSATGITYVISAGNYNDDACKYSPSRLPEAITVGSTDERDYRSSISNYGACVDLFAPGELITSLSNHTDSPTFVMSGTSTSAPHVAGVAALYLESMPVASPQQVRDAIVSNATSGAVFDSGTRSPNLFLYSTFMTTGGNTTSCNGTAYAGSLSVPGTMNYHSSSNGFNGGTGAYNASLNVPAGAAFTLTLQKQSKRTWSEVVSTNGLQPISYRGKSGVYRWRVSDVTGSGSYALCTATP